MIDMDYANGKKYIVTCIDHKLVLCCKTNKMLDCNDFVILLVLIDIFDFHLLIKCLFFDNLCQYSQQICTLTREAES